MPIRKVKGGYNATYGGTTRTFAKKSDAEKFAKKYKAARTNTRAGTPRAKKKKTMTRRGY